MLLALVGYIGCIVFGYAYFKSRARIKLIKSQAVAQQAELEKSHQSRQNLHDELCALQDKLQNAIQDPITKLLGWQLFEDRVQQSINESARYQFNMAILSIDIDNFKVINEALGYDIGDALLLEIAKRLKLCIRQVDSLSRMARDTFIVLLAQLSKSEMAAIVAQRMLQALAQPIKIKEHTFYITACIGIAVYPADGSDTVSLLRNADKALHLAKEQGKHAYQFYQEKIHTTSQRELAISIGLNREWDSQEFEIHYQPIINVKDKNIFCMEASLRWRHPDLGLVTQPELLNYAEKYGKLNVVTEWLLHHAGRQFLHWRSVGVTPMYLGIVLPVKQLQNSGFIYRISQILQELLFNPEWLLFIIQESSVPSSFDGLEKGLNMLKYLNIKLAIDHFGAGLFTLGDLKKISVNYLKLDPLFINDIERNQKSEEFVKAMISLAASLSAQLIIPGVELEQQMIKLQALGGTLMQGKFMDSLLPGKETMISGAESLI
ncbi:MAG: EAL domain-containing protein [Gammaproteobacteria bacterium]|nr:EAL domain-containing protein [Gammaproteobacteria bacterium]MCW5584402.1 EAL domain-containing protein [Gammaproteobacteria bacterium]